MIAGKAPAMSESLLGGRVMLHCGDCRDVIKAMSDNSIDSVVTDPPYALVSIVKRFGKPDSAPSRDGDIYARSSAGFMGKQWDTGETAFATEFWAEVLRVLKPGGHVVSFGGTRTYHRLVVAIEDAGFEIRDQLAWVYGSGFPKSHDVSKGIDKAAGALRDVVGRYQRPDGSAPRDNVVATKYSGTAYNGGKAGGDGNDGNITTPATDAARQWQGWGTALKPAWEPICLARKPLSEGTVAANVLAHGTGALNIDGCRIGDTVETWPKSRSYAPGQMQPGHNGKTIATGEAPPGRWPANLVHDGSDEVLAGFPDTGPSIRSEITSKPGDVYGNGKGLPAHTGLYGFDDFGSAARFFYTAKADQRTRLGARHPTVKPLDLMQWLVRLVTPKGGVVLDPFAGTGTTGEAAWREGFCAVLIERETDSQADIRMRMQLAREYARREAVAKTKRQLRGAEGTPLFPWMEGRLL
jgi:DNA modification methylase